MIAPIRSEICLSDFMKSLLLNKGYVGKLENKLVVYFGVKKALLTHSGRTGLYFLLKALPQNKVYLPAYNCWAVAEAVLYANKQIEYVDIKLDDFNMDPAKLRDVLAPDSIIIATHQFGIPCDIDAFMELAQERNCVVLEDNAAALGSEIRGKKTGSFSRASILSFDYSKTVVSGKGGAILFNDEELYHKVRMIYQNEVKPPGILRSLRYLLIPLAYSFATHKLIYSSFYRLFKRIRGSNKFTPIYNPTFKNESYLLDYDEIRAKLAYLGMKRLDDNLRKRDEIIKFYMQNIPVNMNIIPPAIPGYMKAVLIKFPIRLKASDREYFYKKAVDNKVDLAFLFPFQICSAQDACPNAWIATNQAMALPVYGALNSKDLHKIKSVIDNESNYATAFISENETKSGETRKFLILPLYYYWMDTEEFRKSKKFVSVLRTHEELAEKEYSLKFRYKTFLIDLSKTRDEIYSAFDYSGARYKINKALKHDLIVKLAETGAEKQKFYDFYQTFVADPKRKGKILALQRKELNKLDIFYAVSAEGEYLGGIGLLPSPDRRYVLYKYSATLHRFCENELLLWHAIQHAKDAGYSYFDMSWMWPTEDKDSDQFRLYQFKKKFGGQLVDFYSYVKLRGPFRFLGCLFKIILERFYNGDIINFALHLKRLRAFK